jgi:DNA-binding NarL/FixJ family response regulator
MPPVSARIVVYDNSTLQCELLAKGLESLQLGSDVVCATDVNALNSLLNETENSIVLVSDASMNGNTLVFAKQLRVRYPRLPIIFLLQDGRPDHVIEAFRIGARGIVYSTEGLSQLAKCIDCVLQGEVWVRRADLSMIFEGLLKPNLRVTDVKGRTLLTRREEEISMLVAEGMTNREVSQTLNISESTVKNSLFHVFEKLGISNRVELAQYMNAPSGQMVAGYPYPSPDSVA